ncbi:putative membrane protein [Paenibacillus sacheonensis]|nr:putative membrane protein [Paenibacillus sacheonensis]
MFVILESFLIVSMTFGGASKLTGAKAFVEMFDKLGLPQWFRVVTGVVQLAGAAGLVFGYWYPSVGAWAGIWLGVTMLVGCLLHFRVKHPIGEAVPSFVLTSIATIMILMHALEAPHPFQ